MTVYTLYAKSKNIKQWSQLAYIYVSRNSTILFPFHSSSEPGFCKGIYFLITKSLNALVHLGVGIGLLMFTDDTYISSLCPLNLCS